MSDVTRILSQIEQGDPQAAEKLLPLVYDELRNLAAAKLAHNKTGQMKSGWSFGPMRGVLNVSFPSDGQELRKSVRLARLGVVLLGNIELR